MKRILYLRVEVETPGATYDPMLSLSDVATWAECGLNEGDVKSRVTAYDSAEHIVLDEAAGVFNNARSASATS
jgi:hypothetical protein